MSDTSREAVTRLHLFEELNINIPSPVVLCDSTGALAVSEDPINYQRTKHIDIRYHYIRYVIKNGQVTINHVPGDENPADLLTKALGLDRHQKLLKYLNFQ